MAWLSDLPGMGAAQNRASAAMRFPIGAASPLWLAFGAAASAGVAWWMLTRMVRPTNLEAMLPKPGWSPDAGDLAPTPTQAFEAAAASVSETVTDAFETFEASIEAFTEASVETVETVMDSVAEPTPEATPEPAAPDDLTLIVGIGPKLAASLAERGVTTFAQLAAWTAEDLANADAALSLKGRAVRDAWVAQAKRFAGL